MFGIKTLTIFFITILSFTVLQAQEITIKGKIKSNSDTENIHIFNKSKQLYTISDQNGVFYINVSIGDSLNFSSIQYKPLDVIVTNLMVNAKTMLVELEEQVNELDEVVVGKVLTGDLISDIKNTEGKPSINFYDLGIPGYTGKQATQSERRLSEAGGLNPNMLLGLLTGGVPLNPILNAISGRTKRLKEHVKLERNEELLRTIRNRVEKDFLSYNHLEEDQINDFFYFCSDDEHFVESCQDKTDFQVLIFLKEKYKDYKENLELKN